MKEKESPQDKKQKTMQEASTEDTQESGQPVQEPVMPAETEELQKTQAALAEVNDKYLRLYAEFDTFRRRAAKEKLALIETANENILKQILDIVDDFERAMAVMQQHAQSQEADSMQQGVQLIHDKLMHLIQQTGVKVMEVDKGSNFDADLHEAVTQMAGEEKLKGKVVEVLEKGYYLKDKVLRFAKVVTGA
jgi:molecular chaperone GrpE